MDRPVNIQQVEDVIQQLRILIQTYQQTGTLTCEQRQLYDKLIFPPFRPMFLSDPKPDLDPLHKPRIPNFYDEEILAPLPKFNDEDIFALPREDTLQFPSTKR